jgi:CRP-like cAMP-binding protein
MGMTSARFAALRALPELGDCSDKVIASLLSSVDEIRLPAGAVVAQAGRSCTELVVVVEGTLRATPHLIGPGESLGWSAMWDRAVNEATVVAESDVRLLVVGHAQFRAFKAVAALLHLESWSRRVRIREWERVS